MPSTARSSRLCDRSVEPLRDEVLFSRLNMNPFTQSLLQRITNPALVEFVTRWDELEFLVIRVFKGSAASGSDEQKYCELRAWLEQAYPLWERDLEPYWRAAKIGGEPAAGDPFRVLLQVQEAADIVGNWRAMQTLPAAREALNHFLLDQIQAP